jgi:ribosomal protein S18 acetylase RimI-like enzyme
MIRIEQITLHNLAIFKEVRLRALQESPSAFGSTYARERAFTDAEWEARLERWNGVRGIGFVALDHGEACGIAGALLDEKDATHALLVSMWTAPTHRRKGIGRSLVEEVMRWAVKHGVVVLQLMVTSKNESALRFYEQLGFTRTGRVEPYSNDASLVEYEMARQLDLTTHRLQP